MKDIIDRNALLYMGLVSVVLHQMNQPELIGMDEHTFAIDCFKAGMSTGYTAQVISDNRIRAASFTIHSIGQRGHQTEA